MARLTRILWTPFGLGVVALLGLAGWAAVSGGLFDSTIAAHVRSASVYVAPGVHLDEQAAAKVIGNRRLVVIFLDKDADLADACHQTKDAAFGSLVMLFQPDGDELTHYGCAQFPDAEGANFGHAFVAETTVAEGADQFLTEPLEAVKVVAVNYDGLVKAGIVPDGARTIQPSGPRYVLAIAAVLAVVGGALTVYVAGRRLGRLAARHQAKDDRISDARAALNAKAAVLAQQIIEMDSGTDDAAHRKLAAEYAELAGELSADDPNPQVAIRLESLTERARRLNRTAARAKSRPRSRRGS